MIELPGGKMRIRARIYIVGKRMYQLMVIGDKTFADAASAKKFLDSLALVP